MPLHSRDTFREGAILRKSVTGHRGVIDDLLAKKQICLCRILGINKASLLDLYRHVSQHRAARNHKLDFSCCVQTRISLNVDKSSNNKC